jgi:hypothetical protein
MMIKNRDGGSRVKVGKAKQNADRLLKIHALLDDVTSSPGSHDILELALGTVLSLPVSQRDETAVVWLLIVGPPADGKTFAVLLLKNADSVYYLDTVTENFLASGYRDDKTGKSAPSLFKELDEKCVIIKELGTVFGLRADKVKKFLGDLQAIYDGEYHKATGTVGTIRGKASFTMVACVTPATLRDHHEYMARIGPRFLTYRPPQLTEAEEDQGLAMLWDEEQTDTRKGLIAEVRKLTAEHLRECLRRPLKLEAETRSHQQSINRISQLITCGRTLVQRQPVFDEFGKPGYEPEISQQERPFRVQQQLRNLARGLALAHQRDRVTDHELELIRRVAISSLPADRGDVISLLPDHPDGLTVKACAAGIHKSADRASQLLDELVRIGLLRLTRRETNGGSPARLYVPVPRFADLLTSPVLPLDHALNLAGDFSDTPNTLERGGLSGQSCRERPAAAEGANP